MYSKPKRTTPGKTSDILDYMIICQYVGVTRSLIQLIAASIHWAPTVDHHYLILGSLFSLFNDTAYTYGKKLLILKPDASEQLKKWHQL